MDRCCKARGSALHEGLEAREMGARSLGMGGAPASRSSRGMSAVGLAWMTGQVGRGRADGGPTGAVEMVWAGIILGWRSGEGTEVLRRVV